MADTKLSALTLLTDVTANTRFYVIKQEAGVWTQYGVTVEDFFASIPADVGIEGTLDVDGDVTFQSSLSVTANTSLGAVTNANRLNANTVYVGSRSTPANSTPTVAQGRFWFDASYAYFATANNVVKRVALASF
jgi:hypothetical protein